MSGRQGMGGGPKPRPTHLKLVTGTLRTSRINRDEPKPTVSIPSPPAELSADALREWRRVSRLLANLGIISRIDRAILATYCQAYGRWLQVERALIESTRVGSGLLVKKTSGDIQISPLIKLANRMMADVARYATELGMTPSSRSRVRANLHGEKDPTDHFFAS